jgi:transcriptional regulator with XRE-family HTH domain
MTLNKQPATRNPDNWKSNRSPNKTAANELGERLRIFRKAIEKTTHEMAGELDINVSTYSRYETGQLYIPDEVPMYLHKKYKMRYEWYFDNEGNRTSKETNKKNLVTDMGTLQAAQLLQGEKIIYVERQLFKALQEVKLLTDKVNELIIKTVTR